MEPTRSRLDFDGDAGDVDARTADVQQLEEQLMYFRSMRAQAESLVARLHGNDDSIDAAADEASFGPPRPPQVLALQSGTPNGVFNLDDSTGMADQLADLQRKQQQLTELGNQLAMLRQSQDEAQTESGAEVPDDDAIDLDRAAQNDAAATGPDTSFDALDQLRALLDDEVQNEQNEGEEVGRPGPNELAELEQQRAQLDAMRAQLNQLRTAQDEGVSADADESQELLELQQKKAQLEAMRAQLARLRQSDAGQSATADPVQNLPAGVSAAELRDLQQKRSQLQALRDNLEQLRATANQETAEAEAAAPSEPEAPSEHGSDEDEDNVAMKQELLAKFTMLKQMQERLAQLKDQQRTLMEQQDAEQEAPADPEQAPEALRQQLQSLQMLKGQLSELQRSKAAMADAQAQEAPPSADGEDLAAKLETLNRLQSRMAALQAQQLTDEAEATGEQELDPQAQQVLAEKLAKLRALETRLAMLQRAAAVADQVQQQAEPNDEDVPDDLDPEVREQLVRMRQLQAQLATLQEQKRQLDAAEAAMATADEYGSSEMPSLDGATADEAAEIRALMERKDELLRLRNTLMVMRDTEMDDGSVGEDTGTADDTVDDDDDDVATPENLATLERLREQLQRLQELKRKTLMANQLLKGPEVDGQLSELSPEKQERELQKRQRVVGSLRAELESIQMDGGWDEGSANFDLEQSVDGGGGGDTEESAGQSRSLLEHIRTLQSGKRRDEMDSTKSTDGSVAHSLADSAGAMAAMASTPIQRLRGMLDELAQQQGVLDRIQTMQADTADTPMRLRSLLPLPEDEELDILSQVRQYGDDESCNDQEENFAYEDYEDDGVSEGSAAGVTNTAAADGPDGGAAEWVTRNSESKFQNLKLATLYAESLHPLHREDFLRMFFKYSQDPSTSADAFQLSFDGFRPATETASPSPPRAPAAGGEYDQVYRTKRQHAASENASVSVHFDLNDLAGRNRPETPEDPRDFDESKDDIYREVALFIATNESHPTFLLEFFRAAQQLITDEQRRGCTDALRDIAYAQHRGDENRDLVEKILSYGGENEGHRPPSREHRNRSYDYEETVLDGVEIPTDDELDPTLKFLAEAASNGDERSGRIDELMEEFQTEIAGNKTIVLNLSQFLAQQPDPNAAITANLIEELVSRTTDVMQQVYADNDLSAVGESSDQLTIALEKQLKKYVGQPLAQNAEALVRNISDTVYDAMVFNKVIQQVDRSYKDEISDLQNRRNDLGVNVDQLQKQREDDLGKLFQERRDVLKKMRSDAERDSDVLDNARDNDFATEFDPPEESAQASQPTAQVQLTPAEAQAIDASGNDSDEVDEEGGAVTLEDLPENINLGGDIAALTYLNAANHGLVA